MVGDAKLLLEDLIVAVKDRLGKTKRDGARAAEIAIARQGMDGSLEGEARDPTRRR